MIWWTGKMVAMLRELAAQGLSGRRIAWQLNVAFGTFLTADAVRRQAAAQRIRLCGKGGGQPGNVNNSRGGSQPRDRLGRYVPMAEAAD